MENATRLEDGKVVVYRRGGKCHARICTGPNAYLHRSLKTGNKALALKSGVRLFHQIEAKTEPRLPMVAKSAVVMLDEYLAYRRKLQQQGHTSKGMLGQIIRVLKFWREFVADRPITAIDNQTVECGFSSIYQLWWLSPKMTARDLFRPLHSHCRFNTTLAEPV
jgi:hypothetical protein